MGLKVLVTGANGFIGSRVVDELSRRDDVQVLGLQRSPSNHSSFKYIDYFNASELRLLLDAFEPDTIVHLASHVSRSRDSSLFPDFFKANVLLSQGLLEAASASAKKPKFVVFSTSEVYGPQEGMLSETSKLNPVSPYGVTKRMMEQLFEYYSGVHGLHCDVFRLFNAFGKGQAPGYFLADLSTAHATNNVFKMTKGEQQRDFVYIQDVVRAVAYSVDRKDGFNIYNLCTGKLVSLNAVVEKFKAVIAPQTLAISQELAYRSNEIWRMGGDPSKLKNLGFECSYDLETALKEMME
jgi:nucleoside-diphosphate-sugar epimerase